MPDLSESAIPDYTGSIENAMTLLRNGSPVVESKTIAYLYQSLLVRFRPWVFSKSGSGDDAHDALTEALIAFINAVKECRYRDEGKPEHFLFKIAQYKFYDLCRKRGKAGREVSVEEIFPMGIPPEIADDSWDKPEINPEESRRQEQMEHCLGQIGERCKERLFRYWNMQQSHADIAAAMGDTGEDVSKTMKSKCQRRLLHCMKQS